MLLLLCAVGYGLNVYAWLIEPRMLVVRRVEIASERWRGAPITIAVISDTHVGSPHVDAVLGNHDSWYGLAPIVRALEAAGVTVLWNQHVVKERPGGTFVIAGLADDDTGTPDFESALADAPPVDTLVLSHSPDPFPDMPAAPALMLAGHTHCGQVSVPFLGRPITPTHSGQRYACGRTDEDGRILYTTAGVGTSLLPVRFRNPPEIVLLTLRASSRQN